MAKLKQGELAALREDYLKSRSSKNLIKVGMSTCGLAAGADPVYQALSQEVRHLGLDVEVRKTGCVGMCYAEPLVEIDVEGVPRTMYGEVSAERARELLRHHVVEKKVLADYTVPGLEELGFLDYAKEGVKSLQKRIVLRNSGLIDPNSIEDYILRGGYRGLEKALFEIGGQGIIDELKASGLRGRGGAGFPTWLKWKFLREAQADEKFMICNADEGDPGAYMDRSVLEGDPHSVIEGMVLSAVATGATQGYFYIRAEYPLAIDRIETALRQAKRLGLIGRDILGSGFSFDLEIRLGAGAFVCGEETALMASIEGKRGTPRPRPPFPAQAGLWEKPSNINNVETLANIPPIVDQGGEWFAQFGTENSKGTKVFALTGKIRHSGLIEIPMGTTLEEIVKGIGGGCAQGKKIKAVQTGGPSGGVIPEDYFKTPISYESLQELGSIMGSGGMIVMDEDDSMVDIAKFYLGFCVEESCGKCAPCRIGGKQLLLLLEKISDGMGTPEDMNAIRRISHAMQKASLCGLGQTAPNPILSTLRYFEHEYTDILAPAAQS